MSEMCCKRCGANEDRINGFCSVECKEYYSLEEEINALDNVILERGAEIGRLNARIVELEAEIDEFLFASSNVLNPYDGISVSYETLKKYEALKKLVKRVRKERKR